VSKKEAWESEMDPEGLSGQAHPAWL